MKDLLEMIVHRDQTEYSFDYYPVIAFSTLTNRPLWIYSPALSKPAIRQNLALLGPETAPVPEILVVDFGTLLAPINHLAFRCNQSAQFHSHHRAVIRDLSHRFELYYALALSDE